MIGSGLKKLAQENGMTVSNGVAYGSLQGYAATLSQGRGQDSSSKNPSQEMPHCRIFLQQRSPQETGLQIQRAALLSVSDSMFS